MKLLFSLFLCCSPFLCLRAQPAGTPSPVGQRLENWQKLMDARQWTAVADSCAALLATRPGGLPEVVQASAWSLKGRALRQLGQPEAALAAHRQALALRIKTRGRRHEETASSYLNLGNCLLELGRRGEARAAFRNCLDILQRILPPGHKDLGYVYTSLGQCCWADQDLLLARQYLRAALDIAAQNYPVGAPEVVECTVNLASFFSDQLQFDSAVALLDRARDAQAGAPGVRPSDRAPVLNVLASVYARQGRADLAVERWREALRLCDADAATPTRTKGDCLLNLGLGLLDLGDYDLAEMQLNAALNCFPDDPGARGSIFNGLGLAARYRNDLELAVRWFREAQNAYLEAGQSNVDWPQLAGVFQNLGACYLDQREFMPAYFYLRRALGVFEQLPDTRANQLACWTRLGSCYLEQGQPDSAAICLKQAQLFVPQAAPAGVFALYFQFAEWYFHQQEPVRALEFYHKAAAALGFSPEKPAWTPYPAEAIQLQTALSKTWKELAQRSGQASDWQQVLLFAQSATGLVETLKQKLQGQDAAAALQSAFFRCFDLAVQALLALRREAEAFAVAEAFKSNYLQTLTGQWGLQSALTQAPDLLSAERNCERRLEAFEKRRYDLTKNLLPGQLNAPSIAALDDSIRRLSTERGQIRTQLASTVPALNDYLRRPDLPAVTTLQQQLGPEQTLLVYHWGDERLVLFVLRRDLFRTVSIPLGDSLTQQIEQLYRLCTTEPVYRQKTADFDDFVRVSHALYRRLLGPADPWLGKELIVVPDAFLWYVPFDALLKRAPTEAAYRFKRHPYLCLEHSVQFAQSGALWAAMQQLPLGRADRELLAVAPEFEHNTLGLKPLYFNKAEVQRVRDLFHSTVWTGREATEAQFAETAGNYRIILLSTHGQLNDRVSARSYVAFTQQPDTAENVLYIAELNNIRLNADLVVLSACQTASGRLYRGEGLMSISRAFQMAGAGALVASLWDVNDSKSPFLVGTFFQGLKNGLSKSQALAFSQREYLKKASGVEAHPYFWAGFVSVGDDRPLFSGWANWWWALGLMCLILFMWLRKSMRSH